MDQVLMFKVGPEGKTDISEREERLGNVPDRVYWSPVAAITNYHKLGDLKWQQYFLSQFWRPEIWNQYHWVERKGVGRTMFPLEAPGENLSFASCSFWRLPIFLDLWLHHSSLQDQHLQVFLWSTFTSLSPLYVISIESSISLLQRYMWLHSVATQIIWGYLPIWRFSIKTANIFWFCFCHVR